MLQLCKKLMRLRSKLEYYIIISTFWTTKNRKAYLDHISRWNNGKQEGILGFADLLNLLILWTLKKSYFLFFSQACPIGPERNLLDPGEDLCRRVYLEMPVLSPLEMTVLTRSKMEEWKVRKYIQIHWFFWSTYDFLQSGKQFL